MTKQKVSVCITAKDTPERVADLIKNLLNQSLKPDEIILVDASTNSKFEYRNPKQIQNTKLKIINKPDISRAEGRNLSIKLAKNNIIVITDVGCVPDRNWLENLVKPFSHTSPRLRGVTYDVIAGGYKMIAKNNFQKAESVFLGVDQDKINRDFMPSARSMAFTKEIWKKAGGFPENLEDTAEDSVFNINLIKAGAKFKVVKDAYVAWEMPENIFEFAKKIYRYALGDLKSGIWWHPVKKWRTHNIKALSVVLRYLFTIFLFEIGYWYLFVFIGIYLLFAFKKAGVWGIVLQFTSDSAIICACFMYLIENCKLLIDN